MKKLHSLAASLILVSAQAFAQSEIILDNVAPAFTTTGTWPPSTAVGGYVGSNYQTHEANGAPPSAIAVDNTDAGFSTTGSWTSSTAISGYLGSNYQVHPANGAPPTAVIADNPSGSISGTWPSSTSVGGYYGTNYQTHAAGTGASVFTWSLNVANAGNYEVYARWTAHPNRATNAKYTVNHASGATVATVNQEQNSGTWVLLGTYSFNAGGTTISLSDDANDYVIADAVMIVPPGAAPNTATWTLNVASAGSYNVYARWTAHPNRAADAKYRVNHAGGATQVTANQEANSGTWNLLGTYSFNAGSTTISLTDQANGYVIADAVMLAPPGAVPSTATWTPNVVQAGTYEVYARWTQSTNRATNATYSVTHGQGATNVPVNQQTNGGAWNLLGTFQLTPGTANKVSLTDQANGYVIADAIRLVLINLQPTLSLYYIQPDHLNTPRQVYDDQQQLRWKWDQAEPFGFTTPDENPISLGAFELPLRFPGQFSGKETNNNYNYFRDYDSSTGRYVESDPIGLSGGLHTYLYARARPIKLMDRTGLIDVDPATHDGGGGGGGGIGASSVSGPAGITSISISGPMNLMSPNQLPAQIPTPEDVLAAGGILVGSYAVGAVVSAAPAACFAVGRALTSRDPCKNPIIIATLGMSICRGDPPDEFLRDLQRRQQMQSQSTQSQGGRVGAQGRR